MSATAAVKSIEAGVKAVLPECETVSFPVADGGDGFVQALGASKAFSEHLVDACDPLGRQRTVDFLYSSHNKTAIIEMAKSSGLALLSEDEYAPMLTSTYGLGQQIIAAMDLGARHFIIGIGGSASNDGGTGMASALGVRFLDASGAVVAANAQNLPAISSIDVAQRDVRLLRCRFDVACDVSNLLLGDDGAAQVYAPQKGATPAQVALIETGLSHLADIITRDVGVNVRQVEGGGAAGGLGAGLFAFLGAKLKPGADLLLDIQCFDEIVKDADLVITTEGRLDDQTCFGKAPFVVAQRAKRKNVPTIIISGQVALTESELKNSVFHAAYSLSGGTVSVENAISYADELLMKKSKEVVNQFFPNVLCAPHTSR